MAIGLGWVRRRTREFGIRLALGATSQQVLRTVLKEGLLLAAAGSLIGLALSIATFRLLRGLLFGVSPIDPLTWACIIALLGAVALTACYVPPGESNPWTHCVRNKAALRQE